MSPLRVAFLWHQHQPYYKQHDRYLLPWTRLHATKDYVDIIRTIEAFPSIRQTVNVVPSLLMQLTDYADNGATDGQLELARADADMLSDEQKVALLRDFFLCNVERMVLPYPRYRELFERGGRGMREDLPLMNSAAAGFSTADWRDLQTWYTLTWIGPYSREQQPFRRLFDKGRGFTEQEKHSAIDASLEIVRAVIPTYRRLMDENRIELSVTPFYHPILPLLCDSHTALEAIPTLSLPENRVHLPEDAAAQIHRAVEYFESHFGRPPAGMWPSEGSVSDHALELVRQAGIDWIATDEGVLRRTLGENWRHDAKYFPYTLQTPAGPLWTLYRDHELSDAIGFVYSSWDPQEAARDFYERLVEIRNRILHNSGTAGLAEAVVPVILDGENCWEYYHDNGRGFLEALYGLMQESSELSTVTVSQALNGRRRRPERTLGRIYSGSWIGANFKIWIGHEEDNTAWDALITARNRLFELKNSIPPEAFDAALEEIYIAEGSDWFWWFGDEHTSANQDDFDELFRFHLRRVYEIIGEAAPQSLATPIRRAARTPAVVRPQGPVTPSIDGRRSSETEWTDAGRFSVSRVGGAMHRADALERRVWFGSDAIAFYLRFDSGGEIESDTEIRFTLRNTRQATVSFARDHVSVRAQAGGDGRVTIAGISAAVDEIIEAAIPFIHLTTDGSTPDHVDFVCEIFEGGHETERFPHQEWLRLEL